MLPLRRASWVASVLLSLIASSILAQEPAEDPAASAADAAPAAPAAAAPPADADASQRPPARRNEGLLPRLDVFFPEGDLDLRVSRLINKVFFEGQVKYNFIKGDITAFLRYRYYGYKRVSQFAVFDSIEFQDVEDFSNDFDRVRGTLFLLQIPHSYNYRTFLLTELDRISSNKEGVVDTLRLGDTNMFVRLGYQVGTPEDSRSNAIVGESRARREQLFTASRDFGPGSTGFTGAITYGFPYIRGDFDYLKAEFEALKRFEVSERTFLIGRLHGGTFPYKGDRDPEDLLPLEPGEERDPFDLLAVPRAELFRLDGRDSLRGLTEKRRGTEELHTTWEYYFPWFLDASHDFLRLEWQNWYWIVYAGAGTVGLDRDVYADFASYIPDAGLGFESSFKLKKYRFFLSGIVAQALKGNDGVEARVSVKSYR